MDEKEMIYGVTIVYLIFMVYVFINSMLGMVINHHEQTLNRDYVTLELFKFRAIVPIVIIHIIIVGTTNIELDDYVYNHPLNLASNTLMFASVVGLFANLFISNKLKSPPNVRFKRKQRAELFFILSGMLAYSIDPVYVLIGGLESI